MKKNLKIKSTILSVLLMLGGITPTVSAAQIPLTDVTKESRYYTYIQETLSKGYIEEKETGKFDPKGTVTENEFVIALTSLFANEEDKQEMKESFGALLRISYSKGVIRYTDLSQPSATTKATRKNVSKYIIKTLKSKGVRLASVDEYVKEVTKETKVSLSGIKDTNIAIAIGTGIYTVNKDGEIDLDAGITREELAQIVVTVRDLIQDSEWKSTKVRPVVIKLD